MKLLFVLVLLNLHVNLFATFLNSQETAYLKHKKEITMCVDPYRMPFEKIEDGHYIGMNADYIRELSKRINTPITLVPTLSWEQTLTFAKERKCDIVPSVLDEPRKRDYLNFTPATFEFSLAIVTPVNVAFIETIDAIADKTIAVIKGYAFIDILKKRFPTITLVEVDSINEGFDLVRKNKVFGYIDAVSVLSYFIQKSYFENLKINGKFDEKWELFIGVRNDDALLLKILTKAINTIDSSFKKDIQNRWLNVSYEQKTDYTLVIELLIAFVLLLSFGFYRYTTISLYNKKLRQALQSFDVLVESAIEGIIIFDTQLQCTTVNRASVEIFGYSEEEFKEMPIAHLIFKEDLVSIQHDFKYTTLSAHEVLCLKKDGSTFVALIRSVNAMWNDQSVYILFIMDITEYKSLQNNLETLVQSQVKEIASKNQLIQQQNKLVSMGEMIGAIAHQWRQPLNALNINIQNLEEDFNEGLIDKEFVKHFIMRNCQAISFMSKTIDDFRNFFRIDKEKQTFSIAKTLEDTLRLQEMQLKNHQIRITISGKDFSVCGFKSEFQQVLLNLISNAKDAILHKNNPNGLIAIHMNAPKISIEDNGNGIEDALKERIFEPYFTTKENGNGTGLGLYISKMIIEQNMGGTLNVENTQEGANFTITLP